MFKWLFRLCEFNRVKASHPFELNWEFGIARAVKANF